MAVKVKQEPSGRKYTFYLSWDDPDVRRMIVAEEHRISMVEDGDWDIAVFPGGADICPMLYGERMHETVKCNIARDLRETQFYYSLHHARMKVGICRGAQLLNVFSGGRLWQDVNGHMSQNGHLLKMYDSNELIRVSSRHHQMMIPGSTAWILGVASEATNKYSEVFGKNEKTVAQLQYTDPEVVYYGNTHSLCFQPHPEDADDMCRKQFFELIDSFWDDNLHKQALMEWE